MANSTANPVANPNTVSSSRPQPTKKFPWALGTHSPVDPNPLPWPPDFSSGRQSFQSEHFCCRFSFFPPILTRLSKKKAGHPAFFFTH
jgi:hypothetical protein